MKTAEGGASMSAAANPTPGGDPRRERAEQLISGFADAALAAQEARTPDAIFGIARDRLYALGLSVVFGQVEGETLVHFNAAGRLREVAAELAAKEGRAGRAVRVSGKPFQRAIKRSVHGVLIEDLRSLVAESLGRPEPEIDLAPELVAVGAVIPVAGVAEFAVLAAGVDFDRSIAPAFGLFARQIGTAIETARRIDELARSNRELALLLELGQAVAGSLDQREILAVGARVAARVLRCNAAYIFVPDGRAGSLACAAREDALSPVPADERLPLDRPSMASLAFRTGRAQSSASSTSDPRVDRDLALRFGCRSTLAVPLTSHDQTRGVLVLIERSEERRFDEQDTRLALHAAQLLAASMESAALYAEQQRRAEEMELLNEAARSLAGSLEIEPLLSGAAETLRKILDASICVIYLLDASRQWLEIRTAPAGFPQVLGYRQKMSDDSTASITVRGRRAVHVRGAESSPLVSREMVELFRVQTVLGIPLIARGEIVGAVVVSDRNPEREFTPAEVERATAIAGLIEDLRRSYSDLERTQVELVDRERLAALGELSASIAHEVRNPLGVIFNALGSLRRLLRDEGNVGLLLGIIGEEADRLNRMVGDLLNYSRPYQPALQPVPLLPLVEDALASARPTHVPEPDESTPETQVQIEVRIPRDLTLRADPRLLRQALVNLFTNSFQAMPKGGTLDVNAESVPGPRGLEARLRIRDSGPGIPENVRPRIFHPFFTTKATGTGLGLAVVKRIVESHGGSIALREGEETGTEFELKLLIEE